MAAVPQYDHIVVVVEENHNYDEVIGNTSQAPFINQLAQGGAVLSNMTAEIHPSQPNYFALYAGSTFGTADDNQHSLPGPTLGSILAGAGKSFQGYVDEPGLSDFNHDPWISFPEGRSVQTDFDTFPALFPNGDYSSLPTVSFVTPGVNDDMHNGTMQQGDSWLQANLAQYAQWATTHNSLLVVTWDENNDESEDVTPETTNQIPTILYGAHVTPGVYGMAANHYNLLSTILSSFGLTGPNNAATAAPIQVFAGLSITTDVAGPVTLTAADNPLVVTSTGQVAATGASIDGIDGDATMNWSVGNDGKVSSSGGTGIALQGTGTVSNGLSSGTAAAITGNLDGVSIAGAGGAVVNAGQITGSTRDGVSLIGPSIAFVYGAVAGFTTGVTNQAGGSISGGRYGVYLRSNGSVTNAGSITGQNAGGVVLAAGGSLTNSAGGSITGASNGAIAFGSASVNNAGAIRGGASGYGLALTAGGTVTNAGTIAGQDGAGLRAGGTLTNTATGTITGSGSAGVGAFFGGAPATLTNAGTIAGTSAGALMSKGGSATNANLASITGGSTGLEVSGGAGSVDNAGTVTATASSGTGVDLEMGGTLNNAAGGQIKGGEYGVFATGAAATIGNAGQIVGTAGGGILLSHMGQLTNTGSVTGASAGLVVTGGTGALINTGTIVASAAGSTGADLEGGGTITNNLGGSIKGAAFGAFVTGATGTIVNNGSITGTSSSGLGLGLGGTVGNAANATISGASSGVVSSGAPITLTNAGTIQGSAATGAGADIEAGGSVSNLAGGTITGGAFGIYAGGATTIANAGTISGSSYSVDFATSNGANRLVVNPGAIFNGAVSGGAGTLELAAGTGTIAGIGGASFTNFAALTLDAGANWTLNGSNAAQGVLNRGTATITGALTVGTLDPTSTGQFALGNNAALEVASAAGAGSSIRFLAGNLLTIDNAATFGVSVGTASYGGPQLQNFTGGDAIDLRNFSATGATFGFDGTSGLLQLTNTASQQASLSFQPSSLGTGAFHLASDGSSGLLITHA